MAKTTKTAIPTVTLDASKLDARLAKMDQTIRFKLRIVIPGLLKKLGAKVEGNLNTGLKSRNRLTVDKKMTETSKGVFGSVSVRWTGETNKSFIPQILETGARAHPIFAKNAGALAFLWPKVGPGMFFFKSVWHPGYAGGHFVQNAFRDMEDEILDALQGVKADTRYFRPPTGS